MTAVTYEDALTRIGTTVPDHLEASAEVPILTTVQRQGDLLIVPVRSDSSGVRPGYRRRQRVPAEGIAVVRGEAATGGNTHWLHNGFDSAVTWQVADHGDFPIIGWVIVPEGQSALLIHTDEHGANGIGPGTYDIRQRRQETDRGPSRSFD